nr:type II toxin-antitoxin system HicB family antitoxin [Bifidobacterium catenulatum]
MPITIPKHQLIKRVYVEMVRLIIEKEGRIMKTLNDYMALPYRLEIVEDQEEGGYVVSYPDLPGCITCGDTIEEAMNNAKDAEKAWIEAALEEGMEINEPDSIEDYSGQFKLRIPKTLHRTLALRARKEGISMNQYCVYLLSRNDALLSK